MKPVPVPNSRPADLATELLIIVSAVLAALSVLTIVSIHRPDNVSKFDEIKIYSAL